MFGRNSYYWQSLTKYVTVFGAIFQDVYITRFDVNGFKIGDIKCPIQYSTKESMLVRVIGDPEIDKQAAEILPRMSFELDSINYDGERKLGSLGRNVVKNPADPNSALTQYNPVPYNIHMKLYVYTKNIDDGNQLIEQIVPFFTPDWTVGIQLIPTLNQIFDTPIVLNFVNRQDQFNDDFKTRRVLLWELDFTIKGYLFGPVYTKKLIKFVTSNFRVGNGQVDITQGNNFGVIETVVVTPGLTANGMPTSNSSLSIPVAQIFLDSNFGYVTTSNGTMIP